MRFIEEILERHDAAYRDIERRTKRRARQAIRHRVYEAERKAEQERRADLRAIKTTTYFE